MTPYLITRSAFITLGIDTKSACGKLVAAGEKDPFLIDWRMQLWGVYIDFVIIKLSGTDRNI